MKYIPNLYISHLFEMDSYFAIVRLLQSCHTEDDDNEDQEVESFEVCEWALIFKIHA